MAAGMGSRFGGLKQMTPIDDEGCFILDYSAFDAYRAGFSKVVLVIRREHEEAFEETIGRRIRKKIPLEYAYQDMDNLPSSIPLPEGRVKPWGTAHAIYCASPLIDAPFVLLNGDDYYGMHSIRKAGDFLMQEGRAKNEAAMVAFYVENTCTESGSVSRGVIREEAGLLRDIHERVDIRRKGNEIAYYEDGVAHPLPFGTRVSMNLFAFPKEFLQALPSYLETELQRVIEENPMKGEVYLPSYVQHELKEGRLRVHVLETEDRWYGITYQEDRKSVEDALASLKHDGMYPYRLWE